MAVSEKAEIQLAVMASEITYIKEKLDSLGGKIDNNYVSKQEFDPVKKIVYGLVSLILIAVVGTMVALVVQPTNGVTASAETSTN